MIDVDADELIQIAERQLADAEKAYRLDRSDANQRGVMKAWSVVRRARAVGETTARLKSARQHQTTSRATSLPVRSRSS
jgi:hypothetical protein